MTDPDTIRMFQNRTVRAADTIENAVLDHLEAEPLPRTPDAEDLSAPPTDDEVFDGVPTGPLADVPTAPMQLPSDAFPNPFGNDENWEEEKTEVRPVPRIRPHDPTGCMM